MNKVSALLADFATFFDLATLASQDDPGDVSSVEAVLAPKSPATVLKHVGPLRRFCQWCVKSNIRPEIQEKHFWRYMQCVAKLQHTALSTLDTSMKALKWSYHAMGFNLGVKLLQSSRITGMANKLLQGKNPWNPAAPLTVQEVKQLHRFAESQSNIIHKLIFTLPIFCFQNMLTCISNPISFINYTKFLFHEIISNIFSNLF